ncbi:MAG: hypothetical protein ACLSHW_07655 [Lachnospiraceae bacterium]
MPRYWDLAQHIVTVDASTFQIYMNNMKSLFMEMIRNADLVIFNRCRDETSAGKLPPQRQSCQFQSGSGI